MAELLLLLVAVVMFAGGFCLGHIVGNLTHTSFFKENKDEKSNY